MLLTTNINFIFSLHALDSAHTTYTNLHKIQKISTKYMQRIESVVALVDDKYFEQEEARAHI